MLSAASTAIPSSARIRIVSTEDVPPPPPGVNSSESDAVPAHFGMNQNYPNPFNPTTSITYGLPEASQVSLKIYNVLGQLVATLVDERKEAGEYTAEWNAGSVPSGVYYYRLTGNTFTQTNRMILLK